MIWLLLIPFEFLYRFIFFLTQSYKRWRGGIPTRFKVISVGNLSTGGTGKSVLVPFLLHLLGHEKTAIILRGYGGAIALSGQSALASDGHNLLLSIHESGDEAMMYALQEHIPVVVGSNRARSCELLSIEKFPSVSYIILDDAYQNHAVKKDFEILLLDARNPFDNGHCLPIGMLREKDFTRAHVIILTHADMISDSDRKKIIHNNLAQFSRDKIFFGAHIPAGFYRCNEEKVEIGQMHNKRFMLVAGVGSFKGVCDTVARAGVVPVMTKKFEDHYSYTTKEIHLFFETIKKNNMNGVITTAKDWVKIKPFLSDDQKNSFFIIRVVFEFLSPHEYDNFTNVLKERMR